MGGGGNGVGSHASAQQGEKERCGAVARTIVSDMQEARGGGKG